MKFVQLFLLFTLLKHSTPAPAPDDPPKDDPSSSEIRQAHADCKEYDECATWEEYKKLFNKTFSADFREARGRKAFEENIEAIKQHNEEYKQGKSKFKMRLNPLADMSSDQYLKSFVRLTKSGHRPVDADHVTSFQVSRTDVPKELDWREKGFNTKPINQKTCGSCYAFAIAGSIEGQIFKRIGKIMKLSAQQMVDCSVSEGNHGCAGGSLRNTLRYLEHSGGLMRDKDYPYTSSQNKCKFAHDLAIVNITNWAILPSRKEDLLELALVQVGPIPISINASPKSFQMYSEGVYDDPACSNDAVNHAMLLLGYTQEYWILKNWWGPKWGEKGYMKIKRGENLCGLANYAAYAVV